MDKLPSDPVVRKRAYSRGFIRWVESRPGHWLAYSGEVLLGYCHHQSKNTWTWALTCIKPTKALRSSGTSRVEGFAMERLGEVWAAWLDRAGL